MTANELFNQCFKSKINSNQSMNISSDILKTLPFKEKKNQVKFYKCKKCQDSAKICHHNKPALKFTQNSISPKLKSRNGKNHVSQMYSNINKNNNSLNVTNHNGSISSSKNNILTYCDSRIKLLMNRKNNNSFSKLRVPKAKDRSLDIQSKNLLKTVFLENKKIIRNYLLNEKEITYLQTEINTEKSEKPKIDKTKNQTIESLDFTSKRMVTETNCCSALKDLLADKIAKRLKKFSSSNDTQSLYNCFEKIMKEIYLFTNNKNLLKIFKNSFDSEKFKNQNSNEIEKHEKIIKQKEKYYVNKIEGMKKDFNDRFTNLFTEIQKLKKHIIALEDEVLYYQEQENNYQNIFKFFESKGVSLNQIININNNSSLIINKDCTRTESQFSENSDFNHCSDYFPDKIKMNEGKNNVPKLNFNNLPKFISPNESEEKGEKNIDNETQEQGKMEKNKNPGNIIGNQFVNFYDNFLNPTKLNDIKKLSQSKKIKDIFMEITKKQKLD